MDLFNPSTRANQKGICVSKLICSRIERLPLAVHQAAALDQHMSWCKAMKVRKGSSSIAKGTVTELHHMNRV